MTKFLHWRKTTWVLLLWSAAMVTWVAVSDLGPVLGGVLWLAGAACLTLVWYVTQPPVRHGRGFGDGFWVRPGRGRWRVLNFHRVF